MSDYESFRLFCSLTILIIFIGAGFLMVNLKINEILGELSDLKEQMKALDEVKK